MATKEKYFFDAKQANTTKLKPICKKAYFRKALKVVIDLQKRNTPHTTRHKTLY